MRNRNTTAKMIKFFKNFKHYIQTKIYNACVNIAKEREEKNQRSIFSAMSFHGTPLVVGEGYYIRGSRYMEFGDNCMFGKNCWVECIDTYQGQRFSPRLSIGRNFSMQQNCHIGCIDSVEIGDNVLLGSKIYITDHYHGEITKEALALPPISRPLWGKPVKIGNNVWIGDNVSIMPGVAIGDNVIVGANAVVTHSFPDSVVIAGVPARIIRKLV